MFASIVIPVHNEVENLPILMAELDKVIATVPEPLEVMMVDDCSTDGSSAMLDEFQAKHGYVRAFHLARRGGQTGCYQVAFQEAAGHYIIRMDSDLQDDPRDLLQLLRHAREGCDLVMGLRTLRKHRRLLRAASIFYDSLVVLLFDSPLYTNTSSFVAFKAEFVKGIAFKKNDHRYLPIIAMRRGAHKVKEVIINSRERKHGRSKYKNLNKVLHGGPEVTSFIARTLLGYYNPGEAHVLPKLEWSSPGPRRQPSAPQATAKGGHDVSAPKADVVIA